MSVNKIYLIGNLGKNPEYKTFDGGKGMAEFTVCTTHDYTKKDTGERVSKPTWHTVQVWGVMADKCVQYLEKGSKVFIEGKQENEYYETNNGEKRFRSWVTSKYIQFLDKKDLQEPNGNVREPEQFVDDDIPF